MIIKKNQFKPLYKRFIKLKENIQIRMKVLNFKKKKWDVFIKNYIKKLKWYNKFKIKDQSQYLINKFSYQKRYKYLILNSKKLKFFYGGLSKKFIKRLFKYILKKKYRKVDFLFFFLVETRLDTVLYRSKFCLSLRNSRQLINHNKIFVNYKLKKTKSYKLKSGDLIAINSKYYKMFRKNITQSEIWPIPPKNLILNYNIFQIIFISFKNMSLLNFFYNLNLKNCFFKFNL